MRVITFFEDILKILIFLPRMIFSHGLCQAKKSLRAYAGNESPDQPVH